MKKKICIIAAVIVVIVVAVIIGVKVFNKPDEDEKNKVVNTDAIKFKNEYEELNGKENESGKKYRKVSIPEDNPFVYATPEEIVKMMEDKETFAVYFGFKSCPWCRSVLETLTSVAKELNIKKIYYVDILDIRDTYELNSKGKAERTKEGTEGYYDLLEAFEDVLSDYTLTDSKGKTVKTGEKRIYAPNIVSVVEGVANKLTEGTSSKQTDAYMELTDEMLKESHKQIKCTLECLKEKDSCSLAC